MKSFQVAQFDFGLLSFSQIFIIYANLNETPPIWPDVSIFHLARIWMELLLFGQSWFSLLEFTQIFPIFQFLEKFLTSPKFAWNSPNFLKFH